MCGAFVRTWGSGGSDDGAFNGPVGVAVDGSGNVYVADTGNSRIQKFTADGVFLTAWGGSEEAPLFNPSGVAVDGSGNVYVADTGNSRVQKFTADGTPLLMWGSPDQFTSPYGVAVDGTGNVFVADTFNSRIQKFTGSGTFLTTWGSVGYEVGHFIYPRGVGVDGSGNVYVGEDGDDRIQKFTGSGTFLTTWGSHGSDPGQFFEPLGVAVDGSGNVYVVDSFNDRIQKFACPPFLDNGDGTVTDNQTGLQWEKKDGDDGTVNAADLHDVDNGYSWAGCCDGVCATNADICQPNAAAAATCAALSDGGTQGCSECTSGTCILNQPAATTVWGWLNQVNAANFAGHNDWRLPSEGGQNTGLATPRELETILPATLPCNTSPCIDPIFGPAAASVYWSSSTFAGFPADAWSVDFVSGNVFPNFGKAFGGGSVRAVRGSGPVAYYPFEGNANDASGFGRNGTVVGPTLVPDRHGNPDSAYHFDGVDDYIVAPADGLPTTARTVALWFRADTIDTRPVLLGYGGGVCGTSWFMGLNPSGVPEYFMSSHCGVNSIEYLWTSPPVDVWTHFAVVTDPAGTRIYVDGTEVATNNTYVINTTTAGTALGIGVASAPDGPVPYVDQNIGYFAGDIDDVRIYARALLAHEVAALAAK